LDHLTIGSFDTVNSRPSDDASAATGSYTDNADGTVTDTSTSLRWQQAGSSNAQTWEQALAYCEGLNLGGYTDWRLPTIKELESLVDYSRYDPAINTTYFPSAVSSLYWASTTYAYNTNHAWGVHFYYGDGNDYNYKDGSYYVRAVRGGQSGPFDSSVISVSPASRDVDKDAGATTFSVSNTGTGTMPWTAEVTPASSWLSITSGASGTNAGTIMCSFTANTSTSARTATIRVTATTGATGSPADVTVTQASTMPGSLAASFASSGLWVYKSDSATWLQLASVNPENMIYSGSTLYVDFGASYGLYKWDGAAWTQLTPANPENMVTSGSTLYVNFGALGLWRWDSSAAWFQLTSAHPENMVASGSTLYADFGALGLYNWNGVAWSQLTGANPLIMVVSN
jgi:hypothetical protein